jgi:ubiquinone/menaquinone biosynthesis C-methylase UbiE
MSIAKERDHSSRIAHNAESVWNYDTAAGKYRADKKANIMIRRLKLRPCDTVLEIGCGTGEYTKRLAKSGARITATDLSPELLSRASPMKNIMLRAENAENLSFGDKSFDVVLGNSILHHLNVKKVFREIARVLRPQGRIMFFEPNMLNPYLMVQKNSKTIKKLTGDSPDETAFFRWQLANELAAHGFRNIRIRPIDYIVPFLPDWLFRFQRPIAEMLEKVPVINEFAGVLMIEADR